MSTIIEATPVERTAGTPLSGGDSCVLVIFGASGDLTRRKLIPALYDLACIGCTHPRFEVVGIGRTPMTAQEFRRRMHDAAALSGDTREFSEAQWAEFEQRLSYLVGDVNDAAFYPRLRAQLDQIRAGRLQHITGGQVHRRAGELSAAQPRKQQFARDR